MGHYTKLPKTTEEKDLGVTTDDGTLHEIAQTTEEKDLGVTTDDGTLHEIGQTTEEKIRHIKIQLNKASSAVGLIRHTL